MSAWHLYMLRTSDGSLYTGIATDVARRVEQHEGDRGARRLRGRGPLELVFQRPVGPRGLALQLEYRIKRLRREEKERLLSSGPTTEALLRQFNLDADPEGPAT